MPTKLSLYKGALRALGETTITALTDTRPARYTLDEIWDGDFRKLVLSSGFWNFAMRTAQIEYDTTITPEFGYSRAFSKPSDWIRTAAVSDNGDFSDPYNLYVDEQAYWFSDLDTMYVKFVSSHDDYGYDLSLWPPNFTLYAEHLLAALGAERITQNRVKKSDMLDIAESWLSKAKSTDAMNEAAQAVPRGSWARARGGKGTPTRRSGGWEF